MAFAEGTTTFPAVVDRNPPEIASLCAVATREINEHVSGDGLCIVCGSAWPCERAVLAEHNLAFL